MNNEGRADQAAAYMARLNPELMEELEKAGADALAETPEALLALLL